MTLLACYHWLLIAELWEGTFGGNQPLPPSLTTQWHTIEKELKTASHLEIHHWVHFDKVQIVSPHIFTDDSKSA